MHHHVDLERGLAHALPAADVAHDLRLLLRRPLPPLGLGRVPRFGGHGALTVMEEELYMRTIQGDRFDGELTFCSLENGYCIASWYVLCYVVQLIISQPKCLHSAKRFEECAL